MDNRGIKTAPLPIRVVGFDDVATLFGQSSIDLFGVGIAVDQVDARHNGFNVFHVENEIPALAQHADLDTWERVHVEHIAHLQWWTIGRPNLKRLTAASSAIAVPC